MSVQEQGELRAEILHVRIERKRIDPVTGVVEELEPIVLTEKDLRDATD